MILDLLQWPGLILGLAGALLVPSANASRWKLGFSIWLVSNACWILFAIHTNAWGLVAMQSFFCATSALGIWNNRAP